MLDVFGTFNIWMGRFTASICLTCFACSPISACDTLSRYNKICINDMVKSLGVMSEVNELIDFIIKCKHYCIENGYFFPPIIELLKHYQSEAADIGILITDEQLEDLHDEFIRRDTCFRSMSVQITPVKHKKNKEHKKDKKEFHASPKMICGFLKFVAGGLCCIIPFPIVQGAGAALAVNGVNDMVDAAREEGEKKDYPY